MLKYKDKYIVKYEKDFNGKIYNRDDNYISCRAKGQIYRKDGDTLVFLSPKKIQLVKKDKETGEIVKDYSDLVLEIYDTLAEREITFKEENLEKLEEILKVRKRKQMSEEAKEKARIRMQEIWKNKNVGTNENNLEEELEDYLDEENEDDEE